MHVRVTRHPTDAWVAQQLREATPFAQQPAYLLRDNDNKSGPTFSRVAASTGFTELRTAYRAPRQNATGERFLGSVRREGLDPRCSWARPICGASSASARTTSTATGRIKAWRNGSPQHLNQGSRSP